MGIVVSLSTLSEDDRTSLHDSRLVLSGETLVDTKLMELLIRPRENGCGLRDIVTDANSLAQNNRASV